MIHTVLQSRLQGTTSPRNYNNQWGVPLSMLSIEPQHDYAVLELGASRAGEIAMLAELCAPKVGVITQLGDAHLGGFGNRQGVAEAKAELLAALPASGRAVLADDSWLRALSSRCAAPITWIGSGPQCDLRAMNIDCRQGRLEFHVACGEGAAPATGRAPGGYPLVGAGRSSTDPVRFSVPVWGRHHINAALAAVAVGRMMGFDLEEIAAALANFQSVPMRCEVTEIRGATIINDTYNSNPTAMRAALELLREFETDGRRIVVCGDMAELGTESIARHWQIGKDIVHIGGAELVVACGRFARHVTAGARSTGLNRARAVPCDTLEDAMPLVGQAVLPGDVVLVKGSRVMAMERVVEALKQYPQRKSA
jgi:UDP-N-acetylmuramoyl-tripeptide--D-alanyl-D-alanine ligase